MAHRSTICLAALLVAGCASRPAPAPMAAVALPPVAAALAPLPPGATPGMLVPTASVDGSYPTPNQRVSAAAATWHLRAGLNVAALSCPGEQGVAITAGYNALIGSHKGELKAAEASYAAEYRATGDVRWRDRYDDAMTRLYNFFSQTPVRPGFCAAAAQVLAQASAVPVQGLGTFAGPELAVLDRPFVDFYRAYDAWRSGAMARPVIAVSAAPATATALRQPGMSLRQPAMAGVPPVRAAQAHAATPRLELDLSTLPADSPAGA